MSIYLSIHSPLYSSIYSSTHSSIQPYNFLFIHPFIHPPFFPSIHLSILFIHPIIHSSTHHPSSQLHLNSVSPSLHTHTMCNEIMRRISISAHIALYSCSSTAVHNSYVLCDLTVCGNINVAHFSCYMRNTAHGNE